jgi:sec-independent protein translocase protein TatB
MFDIGFSELVLVAIVALLVFGPDKLPGLARNIGLWTGRIKRMVGSVQQDFQREIAKAEELQRLIEEQKNILERHEILDELDPTVPVTGKTPAVTAPMPPSAPPSNKPAAQTVAVAADATPAPEQKTLSLSQPATPGTHEQSGQTR